MNLLAGFPQTPLDASQEQDLLAKGDRESIVMHAMVHAVKYCERRSSGLTRAEIISICYDALSRAIKKFKPGRQRFFSYACVYLRSRTYAARRAQDSVKNAYRHETPIADGKTPQPLEADSVEPEFSHYKELWEKIEPIIREKLSSREITVLELRFKSGMNFRQIGERMGGLSGARIQQIERAALEKIRSALPKGLEL